MPFALASVLLTLDMPSLDLLAMVSTVFAQREQRMISTTTAACECVLSIEVFDLGEELSEVVEDADEAEPADVEYCILDRDGAPANWFFSWRNWELISSCVLPTFDSL